MNISRGHWVAITGIAISLLRPELAVANSKFLNVQGKLTDTSGAPLTGIQTITFRLYTSSSGGSATWTESQSVTLSTGLFNVALGTSTTLDSLSFNQLYYLGIQVAGDASELTPRQQLGASAYAQGSLGNFNVGDDLVVGSSLTAGPAFLSTLTVSGQAVISGSTTIQGNAFSVGSTTFTISDGNTRMGGNALIVGTATIQGAAFSVGGTTFSVAGGSVTLGGRLNAAAAGIKWVDGTTSTTATSIAHLAVLAGTQSFTGANTFTNSVTFSSAVYGTYIEVASASVSGVSSYTFGSSVVVSSGSYRVEHILAQIGSTGYLQFVANGTTSGYNWGGKALCKNGDYSDFSSSSDSSIRIHGYNVNANAARAGTINIRTAYPTNNVLVEYVGSDTYSCAYVGGGVLAGATGLTSIKLQTDSGTFTGTIKLYRRYDK